MLRFEGAILRILAGCWVEEVGGYDEIVLLKKGFSGTNGVRFTCDDAEFSLQHATNNMVLVRLEPEARLRLAARLQNGGGTLV